MKPTARDLLALLAALTVAGVCVRLGIWQLDRLEQRRERNAAHATAAALPPLRLDPTALGAVFADPESHLYRRAVARGVYDPAEQIVLRGRSLGGRPGVHLVVPLRIAGSDTAVLVNRGWIPSPDAATVEAYAFPEPGVREVEGLLQEIPTTSDGGGPAAPGGGPDTTFRRLDLTRLRARLPYPVLPLYIQPLPNSARPGPPHAVAPSDLSEGPHLGYAVQWFSFAVIALIGVGFLLLRAARERS